MTDEHVKIGFTLDPDDWHKTPVETLWAKPIGDGGGGAFELDNTPFHARDVSYRDVVRAVEVDGLLEFTGVIEHRGHSTYRIVFDEQTDTVLFWWKKLMDLGCTRESGKCRGLILYAVDVPPAADIKAVFAILEAGEKGRVWQFETGHIGHPNIIEEDNTRQPN